jgi:predicted ATPase
MRLLAKIPEDRYQTARGLKADLSVPAAVRATGRVDSFALGAADRTGELSVPQRLYGRAAESAALVSAWERAVAGATLLVLLAGPSGVGKSALVSELQRAVVLRGGSFAAGKFEERAGSVPYAPVAHALRELVQELLTERAPVLERFKRELLGALGQRAQVLTDLIPELAIILGPLPPAPALGPSESQNRFRLVLEDALRVFATKERPLVLFMDDLQWADPSSLALLKILLSARTAAICSCSVPIATTK